MPSPLGSHQMRILSKRRKRLKAHAKKIRWFWDHEGTIGKFILKTGKAFEAIYFHNKTNPTRPAVGLRPIPPWSQLTQEERAEVLEGKMVAHPLSERLFMIECNMGSRKPPYRTEDICWVKRYMDMDG